MTDPIVIKPRAAPLSDPSTTGTPAAGTLPDAPLARSDLSDDSDSKQRLFLFIGGALVIAALYWVFLVLPGNTAFSAADRDTPTPATDTAEAKDTEATKDSKPTDTAAAEPAQSPPISPFRDAQLARAKEQAEKELAAFVELQIELEDKLQIGNWGQSRYDAVKDLATEGDTQFQSREFEPALVTYREATQALEELRAAGEAEFAAGVDAGNAAIADFNQLLAQREFERALQIKPNDAEALAGIARAEKLPQIQTLLRKARQLARRGDTQAATKTYNEILSIDPQTATVDTALAELSQAATQADYQDHLSRGFAALESGRYGTARNEFKAALAIKPGDSMANGGLQQIAQETEVKSLQNLQSAALKAVDEERWEDAVKAFDSALAQDKNLAFAQSGRRDANERMRLAKGMNIIVRQSDRLSDNKRMQEAIALLEKAAALPSAGPRWNTDLERAQQTVKSYQQPVPVRLTSDKKTLVTVYKVGRLGTFATHDLELRPGSYTIVGSADGCQDVRKEVIVRPQMGPVEIICTKSL